MAGNLACKFFLVLRAFGLYLSSNVLVCISLDRFFAVLYPLRLAVARSRSKTMLSFAWIIALLCSLPQSLVFRVLRHPEVPEFQQCVSFDAFPSHRQELAYNVFCLCAMYFLPLLIITFCYGCIFYEISKNSKEISDKAVSDHSRIQLRRSDRRPLARARRRTLRMTVTIVAVFACCWLPYATMTIWYMVDRESTVQVSAWLQDLFFIMAVSNSCMNPLVYGTYALNLKAIFAKTFKKIFCIHPNSNEITRISAHATLKTKLPVNDRLPASARCSSVRRHRVRFQETSLGGPSVTSDPVPCWRSHSEENHKIKPSRSCEEPLAIVMPTILYHSSSSPPSRAVKMVAGILGVALDERYLNPVARDQDTPELTEKNPMRSVPLLDEGDYWLADSHAIIVYLFDKYGKPEHQHLYPTDNRKRATINQRMYFECGILFPRLRSLMAPTFWGKLTELTKSMKSNIEDAYRTLEAYLSRTAYVADDQLTLADISIVTTVSTMDGVHPVDAKRYPKLKQWLLTMSQKDFYQKYNEPGKDELVTILVTMMKNNKHNQQSKL